MSRRAAWKALDDSTIICQNCTTNKLSNAIENFIEKLSINNTWDYEAKEKIKGKNIEFVPLWKWLLA